MKCPFPFLIPPPSSFLLVLCNNLQGVPERPYWQISVRVLYRNQINSSSLATWPSAHFIWRFFLFSEERERGREREGGPGLKYSLLYLTLHCTAPLRCGWKSSAVTIKTQAKVEARKSHIKDICIYKSMYAFELLKEKRYASQFYMALSPCSTVTCLNCDAIKLSLQVGKLCI